MNSYLHKIKQTIKIKGDLLAVLALFCLALFLRSIYVYYNKGLTGDSTEYLALAKNLAFHHIFSLSGTGAEIVPTAFRPPLYSVLISLLWWQETPPVTTVLYLQAILGALTVVLAYQITKRLFGRQTAIIAGIAISVEPFTIAYTSLVMTETLFTFLVILASFFWERKRFALAGFILGLAALTRPIVLPFLVILPLLSLLPPWAAYRKAFLTMVLFGAATISIWSIRNAVVFNQLIPISSFGFGMNLLCGTIDVPMLADEGWDIVFDDPAIQQMQRELNAGKPETEVDRSLFREGLRRIFSNPVDWLKVRVKQYLRLFIDSVPYLLAENNMRFKDALHEGKYFFLIYKIAFVSRIFMAVALSMIAIFALREQIGKISPVALFPIFLTLIHIPLWTENRYLLPVFPFICILAAFTLNKIFIKFSRTVNIFTVRLI